MLGHGGSLWVIKESYWVSKSRIGPVRVLTGLERVVLGEEESCWIRKSRTRSGRVVLGQEESYWVRKSRTGS